MAKRDVDKYYRQITEQYQEAMQDLSDIENSHDVMYPPETIENIKVMADSIKTTYDILSWVMYLMNKPTKKSKAYKYAKTTKKMRFSMNHDKKPEVVVSANRETLNLITEEKESGRNS